MPQQHYIGGAPTRHGAPTAVADVEPEPKCELDLEPDYEPEYEGNASRRI